MEGSILNIGSGFIEVDGITVSYTGDTILIFNDVPDFAIGLPVQLKGSWTTDGQIVAEQIEVN